MILSNDPAAQAGLAVLDVPYMGRVIHPTLIWDRDAVVLVDTGFPDQFREISDAIEGAGIPFGSLSTVILTHQDIDHIGGLPGILRASDHKIEVIAHKEERPFIEGEKPLVKMSPERLAGMFHAVPEEKRQEAQAAFIESMKSKVDRTAEDGEVLPFCGGITVIYTPGHTPGHICLYLARYKTLVSGDALNIADGLLVGANKEFTPDMDMARKSLKKLTRYDIETAIIYHGGVYADDVNGRLRALSAD